MSALSGPPARNQSLVRGLGIALPLLLAALVCALAWRSEHALIGDWGLPLDDAWIHATIARNVAQGHGWCLNLGEMAQPSSGPLWTLLVAAGYALFGAGVWVPKILGLLSFLGCVVVASRLARLLAGDDVAGMVAALATALCAPLAWHGLSGMETPLAALLVTAALDAFYRWPAGRRRFAWGALSALAVAARPETLILLPLLACERWFESRGPDRGSRWRTAVLPVVAGMVLLVPYFALNLSHAGSLFPTTLAAKAHDTGLLRALARFDVREMLVSLTLYPYTWGVFTIAFFARLNVALLATAPLGAWAVSRGARRAWAPGLMLVGLPLLRGIAAPHATPPIHNGRYIGAILPLFMVCAAIGLVALWRAGKPACFAALATRRARIVGAGLAVLAVVALVRLEWRLPHEGPGVGAALTQLVPGTGSEPALHPLLQTERLGLVLALVPVLALLSAGILRGTGARLAAAALGVLALGLHVMQTAQLPARYARNVRNIQEMDVTLGRWVDTHVPAGQKIALCDIGAVAYFGHRQVVDIFGLATPVLAPTFSPAHLRTLGAIRSLRPDFFMIFPVMFPDWMQRASLLRLVFSHRIKDNTILASHVVGVYRADWDEFSKWYDDGLLARLDPPDADGSLADHWRRGLYNLGLGTRADLYATAGDLRRARNDLQGAEDAYRRAIGFDPTHALPAWTGLARVLDARNAPQDATALAHILDEMAGANPNSPVPFEMAGDYWRKEGRSQQAVAAWNAALKLFPDSPSLLRKIEQLLTQSGPEQAAQPYRDRLHELGALNANPEATP